VIIDSGTSFLLLPLSDFSVLIEEFSKKYRCGISSEFNGLYTCACNADEYNSYPTIKLYLDNIEYQVPKENYISFIDEYCVFRMMFMYFPPSMERFWVMGLTFFHNYYAIFDAET